ncbi:MAG: hypothetical protein KDK96_05680 [Chlamydiia bacterium]|nr:hypothetical protein [Chlamydiia bacterium]
MVRIGSGGGGEFSIGSGGDEQPSSLDRLSQDSSKIGKFVTSQAKGETSSSLQGRISSDFQGTDFLQAMRQHYAED